MSGHGGSLATSGDYPPEQHSYPEGEKGTGGIPRSAQAGTSVPRTESVHWWLPPGLAEGLPNLQVFTGTPKRFFNSGPYVPRPAVFQGREPHLEVE